MGLFRDNRAYETISLLHKVIDYQQSRIDELEKYIYDEFGIKGIDPGREETLSALKVYADTCGEKVSNLHAPLHRGLYNNSFDAMAARYMASATIDADESIKQAIIKKDSFGGGDWSFNELGTPDKALKHISDSDFEEFDKQNAATGFKSIIRIGNFGYDARENVKYKFRSILNEHLGYIEDNTATFELKYIFLAIFMQKIAEDNFAVFEKYWDEVCDIFKIKKEYRNRVAAFFCGAPNNLVSDEYVFDDGCQKHSEDDFDKYLVLFEEAYCTYRRHLNAGCKHGNCELGEEKECARAMKIFSIKDTYGNVGDCTSYIFQELYASQESLKNEMDKILVKEEDY